MTDVQTPAVGEKKLHPFQSLAVAQLDAAIAAGKRAPLLVLPTGGGKTVIAVSLIKRALDRGQRALFLAPRRELVTQCSRQLEAAGIGHGVLLAGADVKGGLYSAVHVASIDTLRARLKSKRLALVDPDLVIADEAHLSITRIRQELLDRWPNALRIGLTATPTRKDGRALGIIYDELIVPTTTAELVRDGFLVPARYFSVSEPDLRFVGTVAGDYHQGDLTAAMNQSKLVGDIVGHWLKHAATRRTVVFASSIDHSAALCAEFLRNGVAAEHVDANTPQHLRDETFERFRSGQTQVLCNCFLASYGFDLPELSCVVLARPTKSLMLYLQMLGRGLRTAEGKTDCLVLDHSGAVHRHGFAHDERRWTLTGAKALVTKEKAERGRKELKPITCPECACVFEASRLCPECGYFFAPKGKEVVTTDGELVEIGEHLARDQQDQLAFFSELRSIAVEKHYKDGWCAYKFKEKFGDWPPRQWTSAPLVMPSEETRRWVKGMAIRYMKSQQRKQEGPHL